MDFTYSKILFICKKRDYGSWGVYDSYNYSFTSGLLNSAQLIVDMLQQINVSAKLVQVTDNNDIDREVALFKPDIVVIEALWVVPSKFEILCKLHPTVTWIVRLHSEIPFLANEGIAFDWLFGYKQFYPKVQIGSNSKRINKELRYLLDLPIAFLPNYYPIDFNNNSDRVEDEGIINIGCFGAIRPLKNQLIQAVASIKFADSQGKKLRFHINNSRVECKGESIQRNIQDLFANTEHELIEIPWLAHDKFIDYIKDNIDLGLQVSFTETFNLVAADLAANNIPIVTSSEIYWVIPLFQANTTSTRSIVSALKRAWYLRNLGFQFLNKISLAIQSEEAKKRWQLLLEIKDDTL
jgi:hypothetical protein